MIQDRAEVMYAIYETTSVIQAYYSLMYFLFKNDFMGNKIPVFAAQTDTATMNFVKGSNFKLARLWVPGNCRTLMNL